MIKTWKGKSTDLFLATLYFILYAIVLHVLVTIKKSVKRDENIIEAIKNPGGFLLTFILLLVFMSPIWVYFRKVPKLLKIDSNEGKLVIQKKRKTLNYNLDKIRFYKRETTFLYILEIHATFESRKNGTFEKMATSIVVPNWGLSWNKKKMNEITQALTELKIEEIINKPNTSISEYFYN